MADPGGGAGAVAGILTALIVTIGGKLLDQRQKSKELSREDGVTLRQEWRAEVERVNDRYDEVCVKYDQLRAQYWEQREKLTELQGQHEECMRREQGLKAQIDRVEDENRYFRGEISALRREVGEMRREMGQ